MIKLAKTELILVGISITGAISATVWFFSSNNFDRPFSMPQIGYVKSSQKDVKIKPKGTFDWTSLDDSKSKNIYQEDYIYAGDGAQVDVKLTNGDNVHLPPNSLLLFSPISGDKIKLIVLDGKIEYREANSTEIKIVTQNDEFIVDTPSAVEKKIDQELVRKPKPLPQMRKSAKATIKVERKVMEVIQEKVAIMAGKKIEAPVEPLPEIQAESLQIAEKPPEIEPDPASPIIPDPIAAPVVEPVPPVVIVTTTSTTLKKVKKVPPPKKQEFEVEVKNVEIQFKKPTPLERFRGQKPVLFAKWPIDENTKNYRVQIFRKQLSSNVKNNNLGDPRITEKPIVDLNLDKNSLTIPWSSFGAFKIQVTKKVMSIQRPIASLEANIMDEFRWDPVKIKTSPSLFFPTNNQLILAEKNIPIYMKWKSDSFAKKAVFQFSTNEKFKEGSISEFVIDLPMQKFDVTKLNSNSWFWRVKELGDDSETDWSAVNRFRLMKRK